MSWKDYTTAVYIGRYQGFFKEADKKDFMIDVGAHIGKTGLPVAALGHSVIGFEPVPQNIEILEKRIKACGFAKNFQVVPLALSSNSRKARAYVPKGRADKSSLIRKAAYGKVDPVNIKTTTIDAWLKNKKEYPVKNAKLLKIDVHGSELAVLNGAANFLKQAKSYKKLIVEIEFNPLILKAVDMGYKILMLLDSLGYSIHVPIEGRIWTVQPDKITGYELLRKSDFEKYVPISSGSDIVARCD